MSKELTPQTKAQLLRDVGFGNEKAPGSTTEGQEWEKPILFDDVTLPTFPLDTLPEVLQEHCKAVMESCQVPADLPALSSLGVLATTLQGKFVIAATPDWREPFNLFLIYVGNPSDMKSPVLSKKTYPIITFETNYNKENSTKIKDSRNERERLEKRLAVSKTAKNSTPADVREAQRELDAHEDFTPLQLMADDTTVESLSKIMQENNGRMAIVSSEAGLFASLKGRYTESSGVHIDTLLKSYNGLTDTLRINRVSREPIYIPSPTLTILLAGQPQILRELMGESAFRGRGFHARFLYAYPKGMVGSRKVDGIEPIPENIKANYNGFIRSLLKIDNEEPVIVKLSPEASNLMVQFRQWLEPQLIEELEPICDWAGKLHGQVLRIAGLLHVAVNSVAYTTPFTDIPVSRQTMENAITIGKYFLQHSIYCFGEMGADENINNARYIMEKIKHGGRTKYSKTEIVRLCRKFKSVEELSEPLNLLTERHYLREEPQPYNGVGRQPEPLLAINPLWLSCIM